MGKERRIGLQLEYGGGGGAYLLREKEDMDGMLYLWIWTGKRVSSIPHSLCVWGDPQNNKTRNIYRKV